MLQAHMDALKEKGTCRNRSTHLKGFFKNWRKATSNISMKGRRSVKAKNRMYKTGTMGLLVKSSLSGAFFLSLLFFNPIVFY